MFSDASDSKEKLVREFLKFTLTKSMDILGASSGSIFLFDDKTEELVLKIALNGRDGPREGVRQRLGEGIAGFVASRRDPVLVEDINNDSRFQRKRRYNHYQTNSFLCVPLEFAGELIGVVNITERKSRLPFNAQDLKFLLDLCSFFAFFVYQFRRNSWDAGDKRIFPENLPQSQGTSDNFLPDRLVAGLIHEINNPLDGTIRFINLSLNSLGEDSIVKEYLLEAKKGLSRIANTIRSLLDLRRSPTSAPGLIDINKTLDEALFLVSHYFMSGNTRITRHRVENLPLIKDYGLKLVFTNILKNACDAIGLKEGTIEISTQAREEFIDIKISDTGPGVPEEIRNKIFEPFFTTKEIGKGSGLGLPICLNIINRYKGSILFESQTGKGTTFTIRIPINKQINKQDSE